MEKNSAIKKKRKPSPKTKKKDATDTADNALEAAAAKLTRLASKVSPVGVLMGANTTLTEDDLLCVYSVTVIDKAGNKIVENKGSTTLSGISDPEALPEAPQILETIFRAIIWRPVRNRFMKWLNARVEVNRVLPELPGAMEDDTTMIAPAGSLSD